MSNLASRDSKERTAHTRIHGFRNPHLIPHELTNRHWPLRLTLTRPGTGRARALPATRPGRFQAERLFHLAGGSGGKRSLVGRGVLTRRVGGGGNEAEWLGGGGAAGGDEDLVGGEGEVGIGESSGELAEWGGEVVGDWFGRHCYCWRRRVGITLGLA